MTAVGGGTVKGSHFAFDRFQYRGAFPGGGGVPYNVAGGERRRAISETRDAPPHFPVQYGGWFGGGGVLRCYYDVHVCAQEW